MWNKTESLLDSEQCELVYKWDSVSVGQNEACYMNEQIIMTLFSTVTRLSNVTYVFCFVFCWKHVPKEVKKEKKPPKNTSNKNAWIYCLNIFTLQNNGYN